MSRVVARAGRRLLVVSAIIFIIAQGLVVLLGFAGMGVSNIARTYVTGEAQYSKAQKEAVIALMRYARSGDEGEYGLFLSSLDVLKGDRAARQALEASRADLAAAERGFLQGRNAPADVPTLITGFRLFHAWPPFAEAVRDWRAADVQFIALERLGAQMRATGGGAASADLLDEAERLDHNSTALEQLFSKQMGHVARLATGLAYAAVAGLGLLVCAIGALVGWRVQAVLTRMSEQLAEAKERADEANTAKGDFLANMSHEVRTPLTGVIGFASLLLKVEGLPPKAEVYASRIATAGQTLLGVVNDILDFSKIEAQQFELHPQTFDPAACIGETVELVSPQAAAKGLALRLKLAGGMPAAVLADTGRLRQILLNLLSNAVKFTDAGEIVVEAAYHPGDPGRLRIAVRDTGVGLAPEALDRLFQRFSQVGAGPGPRPAGTGLGLAICKSLVELMGGEITVESVERRGSTFRFEIVAPLSEASRVVETLGVSPIAGRPVRILVVDDVAANRELVCAALSAAGHDLTEAADGGEAVAAALRQEFDLILMDLQMPVMDGLAAARAIRDRSPLNRATPIVALSVSVLPRDLDACRAAGMDDHIAKPIGAPELVARVAHWTERSKAECA